VRGRPFLAVLGLVAELAALVASDGDEDAHGLLTSGVVLTLLIAFRRS
jgi:hypothetical protein